MVGSKGEATDRSEFEKSRKVARDADVGLTTRFAEVARTRDKTPPPARGRRERGLARVAEAEGRGRRRVSCEAPEGRRYTGGVAVNCGPVTLTRSTPENNTSGDMTELIFEYHRLNHFLQKLGLMIHLGQSQQRLPSSVVVRDVAFFGHETWDNAHGRRATRRAS